MNGDFNSVSPVGLDERGQGLVLDRGHVHLDTVWQLHTSCQGKILVTRDPYVGCRRPELYALFVVAASPEVPFGCLYLGIQS